MCGCELRALETFCFEDFDTRQSRAPGKTCRHLKCAEETSVGVAIEGPAIHQPEWLAGTYPLAYRSELGAQATGDVGPRQWVYLPGPAKIMSERHGHVPGDDENRSLGGRDRG